MNGVGQGVVAWSVDEGGSTPTQYVLPYAAGDWRRDGSSALDPFSFGEPNLQFIDVRAMRCR